jgi:hypothetical protein
MENKTMKLSRLIIWLVLAGTGLFALSKVQAVGDMPNLANSWQQQDPEKSNWVYPTNGVHSDFGCNVKNNHCIAPRSPSDPNDPEFPEQWISDWTMFTVLNETAASVNPPPYTNPPVTLQPDDYLVSYGTSYYDNSYQPENPSDDEDHGAMLEYYNDFCLPIFGKILADNRFTCAFASLGKEAFFLTFDDDSPEEAPKCCQFSPENHPPRPNFLKHLDIWPQASLRLNGSVQAYYWKQLWQPDSDPRILFAYAFNKEKSPQGQAPKQSGWYQHPQSFFFSGMINLGDDEDPNMIEPMVSQNYTSFRTEKPSPKLWQQVAQWCPVTKISKCRLFPDQ